MQIDPSQSPQIAHRLITSLVVPRPIGWVSTVSSEGVRNLAPFSAFNHIPGSPPIVILCFSLRDGRPKDTLANILATGEFVVNLVSEDLAEQMNCTSGNYPPEVDEFEMARLTPVPSTRVAAPRVGESPASMECVFVDKTQLPMTQSVVVFGQVVSFNVAERVLNEKGQVDPQKLRPLARLGGSGWYTKIGETFEMKRPP